MGYSDITIIIPTLNEGENIGKLINILKKLYKGISIIVADDGSTDGTKAAVKSFKSKKVIFLDRSKKKFPGLTISILDAVKIVKTPYFIVMDGDLQHPPEKIKDIAKELKTFDIVVPVRIKGFPFKPNFLYLYRFSMSKIATSLAKSRLFFNGIKCKDPMSGFFGIKTKVFKNMDKGNFELKGCKVLFDLMKQLPYGTKLGKVSYTFGERKDGASKINKKHIKIFFKSLFK